MNNIGINLKMSSILLKINEIIQENQKYIKYQNKINNTVIQHKIKYIKKEADIKKNPNSKIQPSTITNKHLKIYYNQSYNKISNNYNDQSYKINLNQIYHHK